MALTQRLPRGSRRGAVARKALTDAYVRVFVAGGANDEDRRIVLADLADFSTFYRVNGPGIAADDRAFTDGQRSVFGRLFSFLRMTEEQTRLLEEAARAEAVTDSEEGYL
jgi:hypothetical protein